MIEQSKPLAARLEPFWFLPGFAISHTSMNRSPMAKHPARFAEACFSFLFLLFALPTQAETNTAPPSAIQATLRVPSSETHVIGDPIPLFWRFHNSSSEPVGFMWEGCCRLNGRLLIKMDGTPVAALPPVETLFHMFAKPERIDPGETREFETFLHDWADLNSTALYSFTGRYQGVLPTQKPQVPKGVKLWTEPAETAPIHLQLLSNTDYLEHRERFAEKAGLQLELKGPIRLTPLISGDYELVVANQGAHERRVLWPLDFEIWWIDSQGRRVRNIPSRIDSSFEELVLAPGTAIVRSFEITPATLDGQPLGDYQLFIDFHPTQRDQHSRVPSNPIQLAWSIEQVELAALLNQASSGPGAGLRNPALRTLRQYLMELAPLLENIGQNILSPEARALADQLDLAAFLKPMAPQPGRVDWLLSVNSKEWQFQSPQLAQSAGRIKTADKLGALLPLRRHLGWDVRLILSPAPELPLRELFQLVRQLDQHQSEFSGRPSVILANSLGQPVNLNFHSNIVPANFILRVLPGPIFELAVRAPDPANPKLTVSFRADEIPNLPFRAVTLEELQSTIQGHRAGSLKMLVLAEENLLWNSLQPLLVPLLEPGLPIEIAALPHKN
jgi:hypothetical protein